MSGTSKYQRFLVLCSIEASEGGARVNGNLNLSRAIGDLEYKKSFGRIVGRKWERRGSMASWCFCSLKGFI